jgi:alpha-2-macroglobulin
MRNKNLLRIFSLVVIFAIVLTLTQSISQANSNLSIETQPVGPRIMAQTPIEGQRLNLDSTFAVTFDREMDPSKTLEAFSLLSSGEPVSGEITWSDPQTLVFTPSEKLIPSTIYTAVISTNATAMDGTTPEESTTLEFTTVDALTVSQVIPADNTLDVDTNANITVIFSQPIVPLSIEEEQDDLPQPLTFTPSLAGHGNWVNSSVYVFEPEEALVSGTNYQVKVKAGLKDTNGNPLVGSYNWQFSTRQPIINAYYLKDGEYNPTTEVSDVRLNQAFVIEFAQPMIQESTEAETKVLNRETKESIPVKFTWNETFTTLIVEPKQNFKLSGFYELVVGSSARAVDGGGLREGVDLKFATVPYPYIKSILPEPNSKLTEFESTIQINFASPMDFESMKGRVQISPKPAEELDLYYSDYNKNLYIYGLEPATDYVVRILPGMADIYGNTIKDQISYQFSNGDYDSYARLALPWAPLVYRANGPQEVYFEHLNLINGKVSIYQISAKDFYRFSEGGSSAVEYKPTEKPIREWIFNSEEKNTTFYEHLQLTENDGPLETGYYLIGVTGGSLDYRTRFYQSFLFTVATDNLTLKTTSTEGLAWVTGLENGTPRPNVDVTFYNEKFMEVGKTKTDKDGLAYLQVKDARYAVANTGRDFAFTAQNWGSGISTYDLGIYENYYDPGEDIFGYVYTDRPVYRPNQDVYFKGILRANDDLHYSLSSQKQVYVVVEQWGEKIFSEYVNVNEQGSFSGFVHIDEGASLGAYTISAYQSSSPEESPFASVGFSLAEYKKPEFEVNVAADKTNVLAGDSVNYSVDVAYYSGGNVKNAQTNWFIQSNYYYFAPISKYNRYSFSDWDRDVYYSESNLSKRDTLNEGEGVTDENGHLDISQPLDFGEDKHSFELQMYANVTDVAGNTVSGGTSVIVHQSEFYGGIRSESYVARQGEEAKFDLVVLDWDSTPIPDQAVTVKFVERQWYSVQRKDEQGRLRWETSVREIPAGAVNAVTDAEGNAQVAFTPSKGGVYKAIVIVKDAKGNSHKASTYVWVSSSSYINWQQTNDRSFKLIADKDSYSAGDTAELLIAQPFQGKVYALVTYERGHIYKQEVIQLEGSSTIYKLPITDELAPIAYVSVTVIGGVENTGDDPDFKIGMTKINIDTREKTLDVTVTADKDFAGPGDEVTYTIETKDVNGRPVSADVSLAVTDKAALVLAPANSPPMLSSFYPQKGLSVHTALGLISSADEYNENYVKTIPDGARMGGGGGGEPGVITVRENFKDTAVFEAHVVTDKDGQAHVTVKLPENLTTWHADVKAVTEDSRVGEATHELISTKPLFIQLQTPRFFVVEDEAKIGAIVHNNTDKSMNVTVSVDAQGLKVKSEVEQKIALEGKQQAYITWDVLVDQDATRVDLTATAKSGPYTDASKPVLGTLPDQGIPVLNFTVQETVGTSGILTSANSITELVQLPSSYSITDANLKIEMSPSLAASMQSSLTYLEDYEYLCMEQTLSRMLPNVITSRALKMAEIELPLNRNLDQQVSAALQRIYAKQLLDGGWNWWDGDESDPYTSAYVVYGLIEARESGYEISDTVLQKGVNYLKNNLPYLERNEPASKFNRNAFIMYVLARAGQLTASRTHLIFEQRQSLSLYGKAYLAQALYLLDPEDTRISTLMSDLETSAVLSSSGTHWEEGTRDWWNWNTDTRTTAIILNAFVQINPKSPITANAVRWLMAHREGTHWYSTQETTWALIALTNWMTTSKEYQANYQYAVGLNGGLLQQGEATRENITQIVNLEVQFKDLLKEKTNDIVFTRGRGNGNLYYTAYLTTALVVDEIEPLDQGVMLSREYFAMDDLETPITEVGKGELVKVRLTVVVPASVHYVVINDPLPAGLEAVDSTLATDVEVPRTYTARDYRQRGWGWWYFSHIELRDEKIVLSTDYLPAGTYVYTYIARASTIGTFNVIPPTASEFYFPDVGGRGAGSVFIVK